MIQPLLRGNTSSWEAAGVSVAVGREAKAASKQGAFRCGVKHISKLRRELQRNGLALRDTTGRTQCNTLLRVLQYLGARGINTPEGVGMGFYRIATRIQELEAEGWLIASQRESIIGADNMVHVGIARYVLLGRRSDIPEAQGRLDLGDLS